MEQIITFSIILVPIVTGLVELVKQTTGVPSRFVPIISLVLGVLIGFIATPVIGDVELSLRLFAGGLAGLSAVGLFEVGHQLKKPKVEEDR